MNELMRVSIEGSEGPHAKDITEDESSGSERFINGCAELQTGEKTSIYFFEEQLTRKL